MSQWVSHQRQVFAKILFKALPLGAFSMIAGVVIPNAGAEGYNPYHIIHILKLNTNLNLYYILKLPVPAKGIFTCF